MPGGRQRQANLQILLDRAAQFQRTSIRGLFGFIRFIEKLKSFSGDMGTAKILGENENVLRIMSIHKSKGLEFPVVIVAGMGRHFNMSDLREDILLHKELGIGPKFVDPDTRRTCDTAARAAIKDVIRLESLSEELRILYVAMTRPKDRLILMGTLLDLPRAAESWGRAINPYNLSKGRCFMDWVCPVIMRHRDGGTLRDMAEGGWEPGGAEGEDMWHDPSEWKVFVHSRSTLAKTVSRAQSGTADLPGRLNNLEGDLCSEYYALVEERFNWRYPDEAASHIPSKLTVTEVKRLKALGSIDVKSGLRALMGYETTLIERPRFMDGTKKFSAGERGTIMHFVLQHLDLKKLNPEYLSQSGISLEESIAAQVEQMAAKELLTPEEVSVVDVRRIRGFYDSPTGRRILKADRVLREVPFNYRKRACDVVQGVSDTKNTLLIQGVIDCCFEEEGQWVLVDYKTDYVASYASAAEIAKQYEIQLLLYGEALERITGIPVRERILYLLSTGQTVTIQAV